MPVGTILASIADFGESLELSAEYGSDILTAFIRLDGLAVGVVASREVKITEAGAKKAASFVRFCTSFMIPIVTITNASGFAIGAASEKSGILSAASDLVTAFAGSDVPRIGLIAGKAIELSDCACAMVSAGAFAPRTTRISSSCRAVEHQNG